MLKLDGLLRLLYTDSTKHDRSGGPVMINRDEYLNQLIAFRDKQLIKVVSGIRRCGKSTLFELYKDYLLDCDVDDSQLISLNFESAEFYDIKSFKNIFFVFLQVLIICHWNAF